MERDNRPGQDDQQATPSGGQDDNRDMSLMWHNGQPGVDKADGYFTHRVEIHILLTWVTRVEWKQPSMEVSALHPLAVAG